MPTDEQTPVDVSVVCPFFNEESIIEHAVSVLLEKLDTLGAHWELIVVNDGSRDHSAEMVAQIRHPRLRVVGYEINRGRGHALRTGIRAARGEVIVTTEIDLSWGEDIVERLYTAMQENPDCDIVVASPNLPGGGYRNVPFKRVAVSRFGNWVIRACMTNATSMNTGMTRAYRRDVIKTLPVTENGKEFHLEVILKAHALGYRMTEIPCVLEWKTLKKPAGTAARKSSSRVNRLIVSHTLFSIFANPIRYVWALSVTSLLLSVAFFAVGAYHFLTGEVSVFALIISLSLVIIALMFFTMGVITHQGNSIQKELWALQRDRLARELRADEDTRAARR